MNLDENHSSEIDELASRFESAWKEDAAPDFNKYLQEVDETLKPKLLRELIQVDVELRIKVGQTVHANLYRDFGETAFEFASELLNADESEDHEDATIVPTKVKKKSGSANGKSGSETPDQIARYKILKILGSGGFGQVFLGQDEELQRQVAIKVPRSGSQQEFDIDLYRAEAQNVAKLEHQNIVPVYDIGNTEKYSCFIVSKYVDGMDLSECVKDPQRRPGLRESALIIKKIAQALSYAHKRGLVHRDIKPNNILLDKKTGEPFLVDFGMALREENYGKETDSGMTPAYMSPEQASGRGHRVDGRSDIFSLGVTLYELVTGQRPFRGNSQMELAIQIASDDHKPMRQIDENIPKELERIVNKALEKKQSDRYSTAADFAEDLEEFLASNELLSSTKSTHPPTFSDEATSETHPRQTADTDRAVIQPNDSTTGSLHIVPKGLRAFDEKDADFFLELLPGARDRHGIPDSIRFWKQKIEQRDADETFAVGLIYGPSGCGKSSLVRAGLLPLLDNSVTPIYIEATQDQTEPRVLKQIRKHWPDVDSSLDLAETLAFLRRQGDSQKSKLLIVIDQFEQWLHSRSEMQETQLVKALSHCDGAHVQTIVMVRDDFWMAATRFMRDLEIRLVEAENSAAVDLFPIRHAEKVLNAFGRAFGALPEGPGKTAPEHERFLKESATGLAIEGKVICVRLALFAEMMKGKPWTPEKLKEVGGTSGIGVTFLEETFSAKTAPPEHRYHQKAARAVLRELLPDLGSDIKGQMKSYDELLSVSGYANRRKDFDDLIQILDGELRLITPTDPEGLDDVEIDSSERDLGAKYYQLTHDYLVHSLREWLTRKQKETRRGRAELKLADISNTWNSRPENRFLPTVWDYLQIRLFTDRKRWTKPQTKMIRRASQLHGFRWSLSMTFLLLVVVGGFFGLQQLRNQAQQLVELGRAEALKLVDDVQSADFDELGPIIDRLNAALREHADPLFRQILENRDSSPSQRLRGALALLPVDASLADEIKNHLLVAEPSVMPVIVSRMIEAKTNDVLTDSQWAEIISSLWTVLKDKAENGSRRLRAACGLATFDTANSAWNEVRQNEVGNAIAQELVSAPNSVASIWYHSLQPIGNWLAEPIASICSDAKFNNDQRSLAIDFVVGFADAVAGSPETLVKVIQVANEKQFPVFFALISKHSESVIPVLTQLVNSRPQDNWSEVDKEDLATRQANAAISLIKLTNADNAWKFLEHKPDPRGRTYLIHRLAPFGVEPEILIDKLENESTEVSIRRALLLALGELTKDQFSDESRQKLTPKLLDLYKTHPDPGIHGASQWLLRHWGEQEAIAKATAGLRETESSRTKREAKTPRGWYVNGRSMTMVVVQGGEFMMGTLNKASESKPEDVPKRTRINRRYAISATAMTHGQLRPYTPGNYSDMENPLKSNSWYLAAAICNRLSEQEGIPEKQWCYEKNDSDQYGPGMRPKKGYLKLSGYRLPSKAELEFACRAGSTTRFYFGQNDSMLDFYAWHGGNNLALNRFARSVGQKKPNDFGLFDMHGNIWIWCHNRSTFSSHEDGEDLAPLDNRIPRVLGGGSFINKSEELQSGFFLPYFPNEGHGNFGFRVARTLAP